jgi:hypothetical protein
MSKIQKITLKVHKINLLFFKILNFIMILHFIIKIIKKIKKISKVVIFHKKIKIFNIKQVISVK